MALRRQRRRPQPFFVPIAGPAPCSGHHRLMKAGDADTSHRRMAASNVATARVPGSRPSSPPVSQSAFCCSEASSHAADGGCDGRHHPRRPAAIARPLLFARPQPRSTARRGAAHGPRACGWRLPPQVHPPPRPGSVPLVERQTLSVVWIRVEARTRTCSPGLPAGWPASEPCLQRRDVAVRPDGAAAGFASASGVRSSSSTVMWIE